MIFLKADKAVYEWFQIYEVFWFHFFPISKLQCEIAVFCERDKLPKLVCKKIVVTSAHFLVKFSVIKADVRRKLYYIVWQVLRTESKSPSAI